MQTSPDVILSAALELPENERLLLATRLLETVPDQPEGLSLDDPDLLEELKSRSSDLEGAIPWAQLRDEP